MFLENLGFDALDPVRLGRFWQAALGTEPLTEEPDIFETRLAVPGGPVLDLCFQTVPEPPSEPVRLHLDLAGGAERDEVVERLLGLGATYADIGQGSVPWVVLADPEGNAFCVMHERPEYVGTGPIACLPLDSADPTRDAELWSRLSGWRPDPGVPTALRHPSGLGPFLALADEPVPKDERKNRLHLDLRLEPGDDADEIGRTIAAYGGREVHPNWGDLPWRVFADGSGNELCLLPARTSDPGRE